jgi:hypothetical protein
MSPLIDDYLLGLQKLRDVVPRMTSEQFDAKPVPREMVHPASCLSSCRYPPKAPGPDPEIAGAGPAATHRPCQRSAIVESCDEAAGWAVTRII